MVLEAIDKLLHSDASLDPDSLALLVDFQDPIHESQVYHPGPGKADPVRRKPGPHRPDTAPRLPQRALQLLRVLRLEEVARLHLVGPAPVGDRVQVLRQRSVPEDLRLLVLGVVREGECVVGGAAAEEEEGSIARVLAGFCIHGGVGLRG